MPALCRAPLTRLPAHPPARPRTWPLPFGPVCTTRRPMRSRKGVAAATAALLPPAMKVSVPASAAATPPLTGLHRSAGPAEPEPELGSKACAGALTTGLSVLPACRSHQQGRTPAPALPCYPF